MSDGNGIEMTPEEVNAFWDYIGGGKTGGSNASLYNSVIGMVGNPVFLLQQGIITPESLVENIRLQTSEPIDTSTIDYVSLEQGAVGEPLLMSAFDLIKQGFSVGSTMRALYGEAAGTAGKVSEKAAFDINSIESDLNAFKAAWDAANDVADKVANNEYFERGGVVYKPKPLDEAQGILAAMGLPKYLQNPLLWETVPDPTLLADAVAGEEKAASLAKQYNLLLTPTKDIEDPKERVATERLKAQAKEVNAATQKAGESAYKNFLETQAKKPEMQTKFQYVVPGTQYNDPYTGVPNFRGGVKAVTTDKNKPANDMWAKMAGSYAARAQYEQGKKPITDLQKASAEALARAQEARKQALAKGSPLAMSILSQGLPFASAAVAPTPRAPSRPAMRTLSDAEIELMSNMLAGGGNA